MTIIIISSELVELRSICDRIAIVSEGKVAEILPPDASDVAFGLAMSGLSAEDVDQEVEGCRRIVLLIVSAGLVLSLACFFSC